MRITVCGAAGNVGGRVVAEALARAQPTHDLVRDLVRTPDTAEGERACHAPC
ncbi:hypothetical protein ACQPYK_41040 [Streptosporangium sp. CA-135522]|uniref:hypothetical protein n=1 Tax=Streptosporangium sp. CA-135522 TaxID=3240072 RepID=UPI003D901626